MRPLLVGVLLDAIDFMAVGFLPVAGDVIDALGALYFYFVERAGPESLAGLVELLPSADVLPTWTVIGWWVSRKGGED